MASGTTPDRATANSSTIRGRRARSLNSARRPAIIWGRVVATAQRQQDAHLREIGRAMKRSHARQWRELRQLYRDHDTGKFREDFLKHCAALRDTQARQREELRTAWETCNAERSAALAPLAAPVSAI